MPTPIVPPSDIPTSSVPPSTNPIRWTTVFLDLPAAHFEDAVRFWSEVTASTLSARRGPTGQFATLVPAVGDPYLRVQRIDRGDGGVHLDLHLDVDDESLADVAARAIALGARERFREEGLVVLDSPGGFPLCLVRWVGEKQVPEPVQLEGGGGPGSDGGGGANRADQLCLDIPPEIFDAECSFWAQLIGWDLHPSLIPEFAYLQRPTGMPVRLLFQRRDRAEPGERVTGHLDLACDDRTALAERHRAAGARVVAPFERWITMVDPTGRPYCLTIRDPRTGTVPTSPDHLPTAPDSGGRA
jgi:hypothetical protein